MSSKELINIFLSVVSFLILCIVLIEFSDLENGLVVGHQVCFQWIMLFFTGIVLLAWIIPQNINTISFTLSDWLTMVLTILLVYSYNKELTPDYSRFVFALQLIPFWFSLRLAFVFNPKLRYLFILGLIVSGLLEAIWGFRQLYGFTYSNHHLFRLTGSFYNPGPYSGYLAVILPLALDLALKYRNYSRIWPIGIKNLLFWFSAVTIVVVITILPAGMSRSAWIAAGISFAWIAWIRLSGKEMFLLLWEKYRRYRMLAVFSVMLLLICGGVGVYMLKKDSANGRLLMWKVATMSIPDNPVIGTGLGGFAAPYASAQEAYFASGEATDSEKLVAGTPDYLFNEYIQLILEQGLAGFLCFALLIAFCLYRGSRNKQTAACGGLIALCVFAFSSYPLQLPSFCIVLTILLTICLIPQESQVQETVADKGVFLKNISFSRLLALIMCVASISIFWLQKDMYSSYKEWSNIKMLHRVKAYEQAAKAYEKMYSSLGYEPAFLFEYAQCLSNQKEYLLSNLCLEKATRLKVDPMIYNVMAKNYQAMGNYKEAERWLWKSVHLLPERIYPYYLLTKLYADPGYNKLDKAREMAQIVLTKEPKVYSLAIREMRNEVQKMLNAD
ncbi:MAG TPA: O-antigen ligase family protein [Macellibacteroides fermentans]|uniref:O-antigen ligase family protein n=1 Tax=Macellibacteroides fermentans TaxID=879969 RepID=UPI002CACE776|nr:O-antigen ligase family protein [Macellibacteroides fermentans]